MDKEIYVENNNNIESKKVNNNSESKNVNSGIVNKNESENKNERYDNVEVFMDKIISDSRGKVDLTLKNKLTDLFNNSLLFVSNKYGGYNTGEVTYVITDDFKLYKYTETFILTKDMIRKNKSLNELSIPRMVSRDEVMRLTYLIKLLSIQKDTFPKLYEAKFFITYKDIITGKKYNLGDRPMIYFNIIDDLERLFNDSSVIITDCYKDI